jgi:4-hydroxy-tetrahydrodipicolinate synthase
MSTRKSLDEIRYHLTGPVASVNIPFYRDGAIDYASLKKWVDFSIQAGSRTMLLTYGDSLYSILTDEEVALVTKAVCEYTAGRAMVVAADRIWWTGKTVEFAKYSREVGADMLMVLPPDWGNSSTVETFVDHYKAVAECIPVMVVTNLFAKRQAEGLKVLEILRDTVPGVMAIKDDVGGEFVRRMCLLVHDKWAVFAGGQKQLHLDMYPYGCDGFLSTFVSFKPEVTWKYWKAIEAKDLTTARNVIRDYDLPYFDLVGGLPGNFDAGIHGALELFGITQRWRRNPYYSLNDAEMERLKDFFKKLHLL